MPSLVHRALASGVSPTQQYALRLLAFISFRGHRRYKFLPFFPPPLHEKVLQVCPLLFREDISYLDGILSNIELFGARYPRNGEMHHKTHLEPRQQCPLLAHMKYGIRVETIRGREDAIHSERNGQTEKLLG